uniref:uncharacterized protein LOC114677132 n=1 Tax=Macaca mulatta TaxID=9544 RepID=UPI0010A293A3|nr:uncharacterized protein LOC114677132 [Macaca mulatta]
MAARPKGQQGSGVPAVALAPVPPGRPAGRPVPAASRGGAAGLPSVAHGPGPPRLCNSAPERFGAGPQGLQPVTQGDPRTLRKLPPISLSSEPVAQHRPETPAPKMKAIFCLWTECPTKDLILKAMEHIYPHGSSGQPGGETV